MQPAFLQKVDNTLCHDYCISLLPTRLNARLKLDARSRRSETRLIEDAYTTPSTRRCALPFTNGHGTTHRAFQLAASLSCIRRKNEREKKRIHNNEIHGIRIRTCNMRRNYAYMRLTGARVYRSLVEAGGQNSCYTVGFSLFFSCQQMIYF